MIKGKEYSDLSGCPFCLNNFLVEIAYDYYYCNCDSHYSIITFDDGDFCARFIIGHYEFFIGSKSTSFISFLSNEKYKVNHYFYVDQHNYLKIVNKIKAFQVFK